MGERSELTEVVLNLIGEVVDFKKDTTDGIPLMKESISQREAMNKLRTGSPDDRRRFVKENGSKAMIEMARKMAGGQGGQVDR